MGDIVFKSVDKKNKFSFIKAWDMILKGKIITSVDSKISYKIEKVNDDRVRLKFYNSITAMWQNTFYISSEELFGKWYSTDKKGVEI